MKATRPGQPVTLAAYGLAAADRDLVWVCDPLGFRVVNGKSVRRVRW
jgi:hypothetical protein